MRSGRAVNGLACGARYFNYWDCALFLSFVAVTWLMVAAARDRMGYR